MCHGSPGPWLCPVVTSGYPWLLISTVTFVATQYLSCHWLLVSRGCLLALAGVWGPQELGRDGTRNGSRHPVSQLLLD